MAWRGVTGVRCCTWLAESTSQRSKSDDELPAASLLRLKAPRHSQAVSGAFGWSRRGSSCGFHHSRCELAATSVTVFPSPVTARTALYRCSATQFAHVRESQASTEVDVKPQPKRWKASAECLSSSISRTSTIRLVAPAGIEPATRGLGNRPGSVPGLAIAVLQAQHSGPNRHVPPLSARDKQGDIQAGEVRSGGRIPGGPFVKLVGWGGTLGLLWTQPGSLVRRAD
jgi:hypothetical protein